MVGSAVDQLAEVSDAQAYVVAHHLAVEHPVQPLALGVLRHTRDLCPYSRSRLSSSIVGLFCLYGRSLLSLSSGIPGTFADTSDSTSILKEYLVKEDEIFFF